MSEVTGIPPRVLSVHRAPGVVCRYMPKVLMKTVSPKETIDIGSPLIDHPSVSGIQVCPMSVEYESILLRPVKNFLSPLIKSESPSALPIRTGADGFPTASIGGPPFGAKVVQVSPASVEEK